PDRPARGTAGNGSGSGNVDGKGNVPANVPVNAPVPGPANGGAAGFRPKAARRFPCRCPALYSPAFPQPPALHEAAMIRTTVAPATAAAQRAAPPAGDGAVKPLPDSGVAYYTVGGERHGVSFFRQVRHPEVEYEAGDALTFDRYHTVDVMYTWLRRWAERYPNIVELYEVGRSFEGRPILQITLTNKETGKATDKPAAFFEGGRHSGEITGSESILWLAKHLIEGYGKDARITKLLDENAIHLRPQNNPD